MEEEQNQKQTQVVPINFGVAFKKIQQEGTLAWEYNPFRNYRLDETSIYYKKQFYTLFEFVKKYFPDETKDATSIESDNKGNIVIKKDNDIIYTLKDEEGNSWKEKFDKTEEVPIIYQKGQLVDFITGEFDFDLNHPVQITPTYSYDNSVDLIINDGKNKPKIINSRFSAIGKNKYKIVDRNGNNDTNIYDKGTQFDIDTSLYKITSLIPKITFGGISYGGNLKVGNYHFYFKYSDLDGNESDFVGQSGLVSVFIGNTPNSINTGFRDQNSHKKVRLILSNIDESYDYILVYYSRATSEAFQNRTVEYAKILQKYKVSRYNNTIIDITGFEDIEQVTFEDINQKLQIYDSAKTQAIAQNRLFLGNTTQGYENHDLLSRLALYIIPQIDTSQSCDISHLSSSYKGDISKTYYDPRFIYNYTGYWDDEIYRFGVVFIRNNNTFTPVYNVRGLYLHYSKNHNNEVEENIDISKLKFDPENLISFDETTFNIDSEFIVSKKHVELENTKGVCYIQNQENLTTIIGIKFIIPDGLVDKLKSIGIKGYFIVRQKRIPTTLCQAYTIGVESQSHTPMLPIGSGEYIYESFLNKEEEEYTYWDDGKKKTDKGNLLSNIFSSHYRVAPKGTVSPKGAICPDYDVNTPYLNTLFNGSDFTVVTHHYGAELEQVSKTRLFEVTATQNNQNPDFKQTKVKILGVEDNVKLVGIDDYMFSARAGEAEEAFRFEYVGTEIKKDHGGCNLLRGSYGPYLGIIGYESAGDLITIKIPGYDKGNLNDYFKIRYFDDSEFYPISDYLMLSDIKVDTTIGKHILGTFYRGDCYICKFTHRLNRNFRDDTTPTNDSIVDPSCWTHNMIFEDGVMKKDNLDKINLGDVNAVNLGMWTSFIVRSSINHSVRSLNETLPDEIALIGNCRGFYPYHPISAKAAYKLPEAGTYNKGFEASVGEKVFEELPIVPYYKDVFSTRIAYSNIQITSAFKNAYRVFPSLHYRDYPITYGEITKIIEWDGNLLCVLEHGIYKIPINERTVAGEGAGGSVFINTSNVLPENPIVISDMYGSQWIDSIIKTPRGIYGIDTVAKKIWRVNNNGIELISDFNVQEFLNKNITLTERELTPIIGIRNVKTHYNAFKHDVIFTFYDDLQGIQEVAWSLCWNEMLSKWITFYSWIPSFSENIYNSYFSFDRETSKQIALLALNEKSEQHDLIYLDNTQFVNGNTSIGHLKYDIPHEGSTVTYKWEILRDVYNNYKHFNLDNTSAESPELRYNKDYSNYVVDINTITEVIYNDKKYTLNGTSWQCEDKTVPDKATQQELFKIRIKKWKESFDKINEPNSVGIIKQKVYLLNIRVTPKFTYTSEDATKAEYIANKNANAQLTGGYIDRVIAVIPKDHLEVLSTDFWKHGQSGIIDIKEEIKPTMWYGKQHPFEFEITVTGDPRTHKIFDNLVIISNKAAPESFHYEIIGDCYDFAKDKKNMYIRQEATKEIYQYNGTDISFDSNYKTLASIPRDIKGISSVYDKSTVFPGYYSRRKSVNTIEDFYHQFGYKQSYNKEDPNYSALAGAEIVYYENVNEYRIRNNVKAVDITDPKNGRLRGNMQYKEDRWDIQINPINLIQRNEPKQEWIGYNNESNLIPVVYNIYTIPDNLKEQDSHNNFVNLPSDWNRQIVQWDTTKLHNKEVKLKDKYIKIRVRYSGEDLAIIAALNTLYSISIA